MIKDLKTAVLIFAHSAEYEATVKPFQYAEEVFESLNQRTLQLVKKTKLPYYVFTEKEQVGATFGERFTNAIQSIYDLGYESIITIGNDTPHLTTNKLLKASHELVQKDIVLGNSNDGGFYLLGIKKEHFKATLFLKLPWQSQNLSKSLSKLFSGNTVAIYYLEKLSDLDSYDDIKKIINDFKKVYDFLFQLFLKIITSIKKWFIGSSEIIPSLLLSNFNNKGSPISI